MSNQTEQADKATGQTFDHEPDSDNAAAALLEGVADAAAPALTEEELATIDGVAAYLRSSSEPDFSGASYIHASAYRRTVIAHLREHGPATPTQIGGRDTTEAPHISRALNELRDAGYVELLVDDDVKKGRIYGLTDDGHAAIAALDRVAESPTPHAGGGEA